MTPKSKLEFFKIISKYAHNKNNKRMTKRKNKNGLTDVSMILIKSFKKDKYLCNSINPI